MKVHVAVDMLNKKYGCHNFPRTPLGNQNSTLMLQELEIVMEIKTTDEKNKLLLEILLIGRSEQYIATYLDRESGRLHDSIISKLTNYFFATLPPHNLLSSRATCTNGQKKAGAKRLLNAMDYYTSADYGEALKTACHIASHELIGATSTAWLNVRRRKPRCELPAFPEEPEPEISIYVWPSLC